MPGTYASTVVEPASFPLTSWRGDSHHVAMRDPREVLTRRRLLEFGLGGYLGLNLGGWCQARVAQDKVAAKTPISSCILIFQYGGPSQLDTFDMKPQAPVEVRGEFRPIATSVPGLQICEHLPRMAPLMHKIALVRSVTHQARLHDSAAIHALTGRPLEGPDRELFAPLPQVYPSYGSAVAWLSGARATVPFAALPFTFRNVVDVPCQGGGLLGSALDPLTVEVDPTARSYRVEVLRRAEGLDARRARDRQQLLDSLERPSASPSRLRHFYDQAYRLLDSQAIHHALDITREPLAVRERYGFGAEPVTVGEGGGGGNGAEMGFTRCCWPAAACRAARSMAPATPWPPIPRAIP